MQESYEIGSGSNPFQPNIWLPEQVLPGFKAETTALYAELHSCAKTLLRAIALGLGLSASETEQFLKLHSSQNNQLRLLRYPPVEKQRIEAGVVGRMPAHQDWSTLTMLWQDGVGGLEVLDTSSGKYIPADPQRDGLERTTCVVNTGDMGMRFSNGMACFRILKLPIRSRGNMAGRRNQASSLALDVNKDVSNCSLGTLRSAMHRVVLPPLDTPAENGEMTKERYSIPYFFAPDHESIVSVLPSCVSKDRPLQYEPVKFSEYGDYISKYMYQEKNGDMK